MDVLRLRTETWQSGPVLVAGSFLERWRGLRHFEADTTMILRARSVHGIGLHAPFVAVGLTADYAVVGTTLVEPGRFARFPGCKWVLELPPGSDVPAVGDHLELIDG